MRRVAAGTPDWGTLLGQLNVQGMAQQLARNCVLETLEDNAVTLCLAQEQKHLQTKMAMDKLQAALSDYFAKPMRLSVVIGKAEAATPAAVEQQVRETRQRQAEDSISQDPFVLDAQSELDAVVLDDTIKPIG